MRRIWLTLLLLPGFACGGCSAPKPPSASPISLSPTVKVVHAAHRTVKRTVEQPGVISAYERTALYAKVSGFVRKWNVDIGDRVKKGAVLVELTAPELVAQHLQMKSQVELDRALVRQSHKQYRVAQHNVTAATKQVDQARAEVRAFEAIVKRWNGEVKRLTVMAEKQIVDVEVLSETTRQLESDQARLEASQVGVLTRDAQRLAAEATVERTEADIGTADARVPVAVAEERRLAALVDYLTITAPYDGVVLARNVNLGDFVLPASGDPSQGALALGVSPNQATPLYVLNRIDPVLFVVGVPEADAAYVDAGSTARVRVPALANYEFPARVTRTSWALNPTSRTLMAQVELPNPKGKFLPGMYAYGSVLIERPSVRAVPVSAVTQIGNQTYCYLALDGKAARTPVQAGVSDGTWVEVAGRLVRSAGSSEGTWKPFDGSEAVIYGDLSLLVDGAPVDVAPDQVDTKLGDKPRPPASGPADSRSPALAGRP
jgi:HlyD family secretion protein